MNQADHSGRAVYELSSLARTLGSWVRIPFKACMSVYVYSMFMFLYFSILLRDILNSLCVFIPSIMQQLSCFSLTLT
jgi:hypothetical protein